MTDLSTGSSLNKEIQKEMPGIVVGFSLSCPFVCNGTNDDLVIAQAIKALTASGGRLIFQSGTYTLSSQITMTSLKNIIFEGQGSSTIFNYQGADNTYMFYLNGCSNIEFRNIYMQGLNAGRCRAVYWYFSSDWKITNCWIKYFLGTSDSNGGQLEINNSHRGITTNTYIENGFSASGNKCSRGVEVYQSTDCIFDTCIFRFNGFEGIYAQTTSDRLIVTNCLFYDNGQSTGGDSTVNLACKLNTGCRFIGNKFLGYSTTSRGQHNLEIFESTDCVAMGNYSTAATWNGIYVENGNRNLITNNHLISNNWSGINVQGDVANISDHIVSNNLCISNAHDGITVTDNSTGYGITGAVIKNNLIKSNTLYGISISANNLNTIIMDNVMGTNGSGYINDLGSASLFRGNHGSLPLLATGASHTVDDVITSLQTMDLVRQS